MVRQLLRSPAFLFSSWVALFGVGSWAYGWTGGQGGIGLTDLVLKTFPQVTGMRLSALWVIYWSTRIGVLVVSAFLFWLAIQFLLKKHQKSVEPMKSPSSAKITVKRGQWEITIDLPYAKSDMTHNSKGRK